MRLPDFLIVGANKAGTSSLAHYCSQHPRLYLSPVKEPMFFTATQPGERPTSRDTPAARFTLADYAALFDAAEPGQLCGEASTSYLANPGCAVWIRKLLPDAKLVAVLRHPIERARSAHRMFRGMGLERRTFADAVVAEMEGGALGLPQGRHYLGVGLYGRQLAAFRAAFPAEQILVSCHEELDRDGPAFLSKLFAFLGVGDFRPPDLVRLHRSEEYEAGAPREAPLDAALRARLVAYFEPDVRELAKQVDFGVLHWLE